MKERLDSVQTLAEGDIVGIRFQNLIRRWEQNNEPPPPATEAKRVSYVKCFIYMTIV
jgi:hypothetical protein